MDPRSALAPHGGPVRALLAMLLAEPEGLLERLARDVGEPPERVRSSLERHVELTGAITGELAIAEDPQAGAAPGRADSGVTAVLDRLRTDGATAAEAGERLEDLLDRHLSAGWVIWEAVAGADDPVTPTVRALGSALLRAGDLAAAAISDGFGTADRERVARRTAVIRAVVDELLEVGPIDVGAAARLGRGAASIGIDPARPHRIVAAWFGEPVDDEDRRVRQLARALSRPPRPGQPGEPLPIVATRRGRVLIIDAADHDTDPRLAAALAAAAPGGWRAVVSPPAARQADIAPVAADTLAALEVAARLPTTGRVVDTTELALERAMLADEGLLRAAVDSELGVLRSATRGGPELIETLDAFLAERMSVTGTARRLGLAPRTITYRLERIEQLRGAPLDAAAWRRYGVLLAARDLLGARDGTAPDPAGPVPPTGGAPAG